MNAATYCAGVGIAWRLASMRERAKVMTGLMPFARAACSHSSTSAICQSYCMVAHATERRAIFRPSALKRGSPKNSDF